MSMVAAKCPVCGRDIAFDENIAEYTCVFCEAKLKTAALKSEQIGGRRNDPFEKPVAPVRNPVRPPAIRDDEPKHETKHEAKSSEPELSEEEKKHELEKKAGYKQELRDVNKQIDDLRAKRDPLKNQLKNTKFMTVAGVVVAGVVLLAAIFLMDDGRLNQNVILMGAVIVGVIAIFMIVFSLIRKSETEKAQKKLEKTITEKKKKRDDLIGRLNHINKKLHIHHEHHE